MNVHVLLLFISVLAWSEINLCTATSDAELTVSFTPTSYTVTEGEAVSVCVTVTPALVGEAMVVVVRLISSEGFSQDLTVDPTSTLTLTNTITQVCWNVAAIDDPIFENSESFTLTIVPMTAGVSVGQQSTVTVMDNDNVIVAMTNDQRSVTEEMTVMVCVTLTGQLGRSVLVDLTSTIGTASSSDFSLAPGELTFTASDSTTPCSVVTATSDDIFEDDETFTVTLNPDNLPSGVTISGESSTTVTIPANGDVTIQIVEMQKQVTEGQTVTVCASLTGLLGRSVVVGLTSTIGTASSSDFSLAPGELTFTASDSTTPCSVVTATSDDIFEDDETFTVTLNPNSLPSGVTISGESSTTVTIPANGDVTIQIVEMQKQVTEGQMVTVCASLTGLLGRSVVVGLTSTIGTASSSDFSLAPGELTFTASDSSTTQKCSVVTATSDDIFEDDETFTVTLNPNSLPSGVTISGGSSTTVTILANGDVTIQMVEMQKQVTEGWTVTVCASLTGLLGRSVVVGLTSTIGTASSSDFSLAPGELTFTASDSTTPCSVVTATSDDIFEDDETFTVTLNPNSLPSGVTISGESSTTVTIPANGDVTIQIVEMQKQVTEGQTVTVCASLTGLLGRSVVVGLTSTIGTASSSDFSLAPGELTFTASDSSTTQKCSVVTATSDDIFEDDETFTVTLNPNSLPSGVTISGGSSTTVTIPANGDVTIQIVEMQKQVTEGQTVTVCASLTGLLGRSVVVGLTSTIGTASSSDFSLAPGELTFTASDLSTTQKCSVVSATSDLIFEDDETFTVTLNPNSLPSGVTISGESSTTVTIPANGGVIIQMMEIQKQVTEGGVVTVCASLTGQLGRNVEVRLATSSGGTASDTDFLSASVTRTFTTTDITDKCIMVIMTSEDNIFEANEMFTVSLSVVSPTTGATVIVGRSQTTVIIVDDDEVMVEIRTSGVTNSDGDILLDEGQSVEVCVSVSGATISEREVVVHVATSELPDDEKPATSGIDYQDFTMDATFTSSQSQVCVNIQTLLEMSPIYENNEVFSVSLSDSSANPRIRLGAQKTVRIRDIDRALVSLVNPTIVQNEGDGDVSVCARLDSPAGGTEKDIFITLNYRISSAEDFTFPFNSRVGDTQCLTITVTNNHVYQTSPVLTQTITLNKNPMALNQGRLDLGNTVTTTVTVNDDDDAVISMTTPTMTSTEGGVVEVCANLVSPSGGTSVPITIVFTWSGGSSTATFSANSNANTRPCIQLTVADDDIYGTSLIPVYNVVLSSPTSRVTVGGISQTTITVNDDDDPVLALSQLSYTFAEATEETGQICVVLEGPSGGLATGTLEVLFTIDTGNINRPATPQVDFTTSSLVQTRQFSTIGESRCISVTIVDDDTADPGESFQVTVTSTNNRVTFRGGAVAIVIIDNDDVLPGATNLRNSTTESRSVTLMWDHPDTTSITVTLIEYSVQVTGTGGFTSMSLTNLNSSFIVINNLFPYQQYQFSVSAIYQLDNIGEEVSIVVRTRQEVPGGPSAMLMASPTATTLTLSWGPPAEPNGVIIAYTLYVDYLNGTTTTFNTTSEQFTISPLSPYQTVSVQVSASTSVGEGPKTPSMEFTTAEAKSGPVGSLRVLRVNETTFTVNWTESADVNGVLLTYTISVNEEESNSAVTEYNTLATSFSIHELVPYTPYVVSVAAINGAGAGEPVSVVEFTAEGIPLIHPRDIGSTRLNGTAVRVSWRPLSRSEARGFITNYTITYWRVGSNAANASTITVSGEDASSAIIINLDPNSDYYFTVSAGTVQGVGNVSVAMVILPQSGTMVVLIAGAVAGLVVAVVLLIIVVCIVCIVRRRRQHDSFAPKHKLMKPAPPPKPIRSPDTYPLHEKEVESQEDLHKEEVDEVDTAFDTSDDIAVVDFASHVRELHKDDDTDFESEYRSIKDGNHSWNVAQLPQNKFKKNRFTNIFPYDHCRVKLQSTDTPGSDYINASWIKGYKRDNAYVAAQGPMASTVEDFWRMIWENKLPTIVMVTKLVESSREKCARYWPSATGEEMEVGLNIVVLLKEIKLFTDYEIRIMSITNASEPGSSPFLVTHFYYLGWPDHGVPQYATSLLGYLRRVRKSHPVSGTPLLVHCSAGVGRTGTFIVLDAMLQRIQEERVVNVYQFVRELRERRCLMVQTMSQYVFIHDSLDELITCGDTEIAAHNLNIAINQLGRIASGKSLSGYEEQFQLLEQVSRKPSQQDRDIIASQEVESKNRYHDKFPYDAHRPKLMGSSKQDQYINASFIDGYKHRRCFVVTQAPLDNTVLDFWKMAKNLESRTIVLLCDLTENGKDMCTQYWPDKVDGEVNYGKMTIKLLSEKLEKEISVRKLEISQTLKVTGSDCYVLTMFHCKTWNENGTPPAPESVIHLNELVVNSQKSTGNKPIIVMCNDGCGRSGTFLSVYSAIDRFKVEAVVDVFQCVKSARIQRMALVANTEQYILVHEVLKNYMNSFDQYANFAVL
ncbi:mucin-3A-like isoform X2 [Halichondria panicea]|uniref:mucin-3A-like isoform X2 n=1 Tax=Halichondria panicea TaxID=6063 RepID=UPI00312B5120